MRPLPKVQNDLMLAPVATEIDQNLQLLRDKSPSQLEYLLELELDRPEFNHTREERAERVLEMSLRNVDVRGCHAQVTSDADRVHISDGASMLDIGLSASILEYIVVGAARR